MTRKELSSPPVRRTAHETARSSCQSLNAALDHRHTYATYKDFLSRTLHGVQRVLKPGKDPVPLAAHIWEDLHDQTDLRLDDLIEDQIAVGNKVSRIWGDTKGQATNRDSALVLARTNVCLPEVTALRLPGRLVAKAIRILDTRCSYAAAMVWRSFAVAGARNTCAYVPMLPGEAKSTRPLDLHTASR
ncbi:MAG: hypothetical protein QOC76_560 [Mycobacterium sp.]|nr:hypothetical protein [Mycobacterium sp.]